MTRKMHWLNQITVHNQLTTVRAQQRRPDARLFCTLDYKVWANFKPNLPDHNYWSLAQHSTSASSTILTCNKEKFCFRTPSTYRQEGLKFWIFIIMLRIRPLPLASRLRLTQKGCACLLPRAKVNQALAGLSSETVEAITNSVPTITRWLTRLVYNSPA